MNYDDREEFAALRLRGDSIASKAVADFQRQREGSQHLAQASGAPRRLRGSSKKSRAGRDGSPGRTPARELDCATDKSLFKNAEFDESSRSMSEFDDEPEPCREVQERAVIEDDYEDRL